VRSTADQLDSAHEWIYVVYDPSKPGTQTPTGTTYGCIERGLGSQSGIFFFRYDGATGAMTTPTLLDNEATGHQLFPDISATAVSCTLSGGTVETTPVTARRVLSVTAPTGGPCRRSTCSPRRHPTPARHGPLR
jgi:hypothetical protein